LELRLADRHPFDSLSITHVQPCEDSKGVIFWLVAGPIPWNLMTGSFSTKDGPSPAR
jgi:hypothetical protein